MADMLVRLSSVADDPALYKSLAVAGVEIRRALAPDRSKILRFIELNAESQWPQESKESWLGECESALSNHPPTCFIAVKNKTIVGFACYNATVIEDSTPGVYSRLIDS